MACAHAKFTGEVGVCLATQGPGAIHLLNGLYDAKLDHQPVVAIVGACRADVGGSRYQQEVDLPTLFKDVAGRLRRSRQRPRADPARHRPRLPHRPGGAHRHLRHRARTTCRRRRSSLTRRISMAPCTRLSANAAPRVIPQQAELQRAADVLNAGQRVAILIGAGRCRERHRR